MMKYMKKNLKAVFNSSKEASWCSEYNAKKSRTQETKHLSTDADSSTDAILGWTKNTHESDFFEKRKDSSKPKNSKTSRNMAKLAINPSTRGL